MERRSQSTNKDKFFLFLLLLIKSQNFATKKKYILKFKPCIFTIHVSDSYSEILYNERKFALILEIIKP